ncbi:hypothetical protein ABW21_db0206450 [Orbilia brochopaga]|nr:hypothetical protein ABW21_db0206450 [Drechslerella brochopaga]
MRREYDFPVYCCFKRFFKGWGGLPDNRSGIRKVISKHREDIVVARLLKEKGTGTVVRALQSLLGAKAFNKATKFEDLFPSIARPEPFVEGANGSKIPGSTTTAPAPKPAPPLKPAQQSASIPATASLNSSAAADSNPGPSTDAKPSSDAASSSDIAMPDQSDAVAIARLLDPTIKCDLDLSRWRPAPSAAEPIARPATKPAPVVTKKPTAHSAGPIKRATVRPEAKPATTKAGSAAASRPTRNNESCLKPGATKRPGFVPSKVTKAAGGRPDKHTGNRVQDRLAAIQDRKLVGAWGGALASSEPAPPTKKAENIDPQRLSADRETSYKLVNHDPWYAEKPVVVAEAEAEAPPSVAAPVIAPVTSTPVVLAAEGGQVPFSHETDLTIKSYFPIDQQAKILVEAQRILTSMALRVVESEKPAVLANIGVAGRSQLTLPEAALALRLGNGEPDSSSSFQSFAWLERAIIEGRRMEPGTLAQLICSCVRETEGLRDIEGPEALGALKCFTVEAAVQIMDNQAEKLRKEADRLSEKRAEMLTW